jgi:hypothetical protein
MHSRACQLDFIHPKDRTHVHTFFNSHIMITETQAQALKSGLSRGALIRYSCRSFGGGRTGRCTTASSAEICRYEDHSVSIGYRDEMHDDKKHVKWVGHAHDHRL